MRPIAEGLFTDEQPPRLIGGLDRETGRIVFFMPARQPLGRLSAATRRRRLVLDHPAFRPKSPPEPTGASGLRQVAGDPKTAYSHVYGAPGVSAVTILER